jgi:hypothetical protein
MYQAYPGAPEALRAQRINFLFFGRYRKIKRIRSFGE